MIVRIYRLRWSIVRENSQGFDRFRGYTSEEKLVSDDWRQIGPCRPPRKSSRPPESLQKTRYATSRNPRNGAAILAVPRLNLLCSHDGRSGLSSSPAFEFNGDRGRRSRPNLAA